MPELNFDATHGVTKAPRGMTIMTMKANKDKPAKEPSTATTPMNGGQSDRGPQRGDGIGGGKLPSYDGGSDVKTVRLGIVLDAAEEAWTSRDPSGPASVRSMDATRRIIATLRAFWGDRTVGEAQRAYKGGTVDDYIAWRMGLRVAYAREAFDNPVHPVSQATAENEIRMLRKATTEYAAARGLAGLPGF
jgi:hypothetical protein